MANEPFWITESLRLSNEKLKTLRAVVHKRSYESPDEEQLVLRLWQ
jgi:hypothetical protein